MIRTAYWLNKKQSYSKRKLFHRTLTQSNRMEVYMLIQVDHSIDHNDFLLLKNLVRQFLKQTRKDLMIKRLRYYSWHTAICSFVSNRCPVYKHACLSCPYDYSCIMLQHCYYVKRIVYTFWISLADSYYLIFPHHVCDYMLQSFSMYQVMYSFTINMRNLVQRFEGLVFIGSSGVFI